LSVCCRIVIEKEKSKQKADAKGAKEKGKEQEANEKAELKSAGWKYSGATAMIHARWLRLQSKTPAAGGSEIIMRSECAPA